MTRKRTIDDFSSGNFKIHGHLETSFENGIFITHSTGPFNIEWVIALDKLRHDCLVDITATYKNASITIFHNSMLMSEEALNAFSENIKQHLSEIQIAPIIAYVVPPEIEGRSIMLPFFANMFSKVNVNWQVFKDIDDAKVWVQSLLAA